MDANIGKDDLQVVDEVRQPTARERALVVEQAALTGTCACRPCCSKIAAEVLPERRQVVEVVIQRAVTDTLFQSLVPTFQGSPPIPRLALLNSYDET